MGIADRFHWSVGVEVVYGARRAAIHDFRNGVVYSVNGAAAAVLRALEAGDNPAGLEPAGRAFLGELIARGLGRLGPASPSIPPAAGPLPDAPAHPLDFLWVELNGECNLGCTFCYAGAQHPALYPAARPRPAGAPLTFDEWRDVLRQAAELGCRAVQFIGGEAMLDRRLPRLLAAAAELGFTFIEVFTNGTTLTDAAARALARRGVAVAVSLHGSTAATHDDVTGRPGSFDRATAGLAALRRHGVAVRLASVAVAGNQDDILALDDVAAGLGLGAPAIDVVRPIDAADRRLLPTAPAVLGRSWLLEPAFVADRARFDHNRRWNPCWAGKLAIAPNGDFMPCVMGRGEVVGNARTDALADVAAGPGLRRLWGLTKDEIAVCRDCEYRYVCGDCRPLAAAESGLTGKTARCTYDPARGDWGRPWSDERVSSPAAEGGAPALASLPSDGLHPAHARRRNHFFGCNPDRSLPDTVPAPSRYSIVSG